MFIPIYDDNPLKRIPFQFVTVTLIAINIAVFVFEMTSGIDQGFIASFAIVPSELFQVAGFNAAPVSTDAVPVPEWYTLITYMFFHGDVLHLTGNMLFLWVFGDNVEDAMGHWKFLFFYLVCGVLAGILHAAVTQGVFGGAPLEIALTGGETENVPPGSVPLIGASGAVAGVIAAYLMLHPYVRVWVLAFRFIPLRISAAFALGAWVLTQIVMVVLPQAGPVAWWAHIGGLIAGAVLVLLLRRRGVALFDRGVSSA